MTLPVQPPSPHERPSGSPSPRRWPPRDGRTPESPITRDAAEASGRRSPARSTRRGPTAPSGSTCSPTSSKGASSARTTAGSAGPSRRPASAGRRPASGFDRDGDGQVARGEFPGPDADFARLDRDRDRALTAADFDFSPHALTPSPGAMLFYRADRDGNGKVTREEFDGLFKAGDSGGAGLPVALRPPGGLPRRRAARRGAAADGAERAVEGDPGPRPLPPGDRLAPARARARRDGPRLHPQDERRRGGGHALEARRPEAGRPRLRQLHLRPVPQPGGERREALPDATRTGRRSSWSTSARPTRPTAGDGEQRPRRGRPRPAAHATRSGSRSPRPAAQRSAWASRCSSTRSTTPSAPATAGCPAGST